jgi:hypothetical protein
MCIMPKMPAMPSADDMARQQLETQRQLQADADARAAGQLEDERKNARRAQIRRNRRRRGRASLITRRDVAGGLFGATDMGTGANTISPLGTDLTQIGN